LHQTDLADFSTKVTTTMSFDENNASEGTADLKEDASIPGSTQLTRTLYDKDKNDIKKKNPEKADEEIKISTDEV